jgi:hypothetical protein
MNDLWKFILTCRIYNKERTVCKTKSVYRIPPYFSEQKNPTAVENSSISFMSGLIKAQLWQFENSSFIHLVHITVCFSMVLILSFFSLGVQLVHYLMGLC